MDDSVGLDEAVRRAARSTDAEVAAMDLNAGYTALLAEVLNDEWQSAPSERIRTLATARKRRARKSIVALTASGVLLAGGGASAAAYFASAHTGESASKYEPGDRSEVLRADASDFKTVLRDLTKDYPIAPPYTLDYFLDRMNWRSPDGMGVLISVNGGTGRVAIAAYGSWQNYWLRADAAHDPAERARALQLMRQISLWPVIAQVNDASSLKQLTDAAERGDRATLVRYQEINFLPLATAQPTK